MKTKVINFLGGPGSGKSATAASLFGYMKSKDLNVELINEFAKELVWSERHFEFGNQIFLGINQYHKQWVLKNKVDYIITDSPLILNLSYFEIIPNYIFDLYEHMYYEFDNHNFFLKRGNLYSHVGRNEDESNAKEIDGKIKNLLSKLNISYNMIENYDLNKVIEILEI